jgi:hypothetical protein
MTLEKAIQKEKQKLINKAKKKGLYENFGQKEVSKLEDTFNYRQLVYGTPEERDQADLIRLFSNWCSHFDLSQF